MALWASFTGFSSVYLLSFVGLLRSQGWPERSLGGSRRGYIVTTALFVANAPDFASIAVYLAMWRHFRRKRKQAVQPEVMHMNGGEEEQGGGGGVFPGDIHGLGDAGGADGTASLDGDGDGDVDSHTSGSSTQESGAKSEDLVQVVQCAGDSNLTLPPLHHHPQNPQVFLFLLLLLPRPTTLATTRPAR